MAAKKTAVKVGSKKGASKPSTKQPKGGKKGLC